MKHGKVAKGYESMRKLRSHEIIAARDYYYSYVIYQEEVKEAAGSNYFTRLWDCFRIPRIRRSNYGASTVMLAQQMCGINIISFYSSTIFTDVGYTDTEALYASLGYGAIQVISTIPTLFLIDTKGRRTLCLAVSFQPSFFLLFFFFTQADSRPSGIDLPLHVYLPAGRWSVHAQPHREPG